MTQSLPRSNSTPENWLYLGIAAASVLTFGIKSPDWEWLMWSARGIGVGCAVQALLPKREEESSDEATAEEAMIAHYEMQSQQLQHQYQAQLNDQLAQIHTQYQAREQHLIQTYHYQLTQAQRELARLEEERKQLQQERTQLHEWAEKESNQIEEMRHFQTQQFEEKEQRLLAQFEQDRQMAQEDLQALLDKELAQAEAKIAYVARERDELAQLVQDLRLRVQLLNRCRRPPRNGGANDKANEIIDVCEEQGILVDCFEPPYTSHNTDVIWLEPKKGVLAKDVIKLAPDFQLRLGVNQEVKCSITEGKIKIEIHRDKEALIVSKAKQKSLIESQLATVEKTKESNTGYFLVGNSGSAKSSAGLYVAGMLTQDNPAELLVLDPHGKENTRKLWGRYNLPVISKIEAIVEQLYLLEAELDRRLNSDDEAHSPLLILIDEVSSLFERLEKEGIKQVTRILKRLGAEGRKYSMTLICMIHSDNCAALGIDSKQRSNYVQLVFGRLAGLYVQNRWNDKDPKKQWIEDKAYPCLIVEGAEITLAKHPTHDAYEVVKNLQEPQNLIPVHQIPLTVKLASGYENLRYSLTESTGASPGAGLGAESPAPVQPKPDAEVVNRLNFALTLNCDAAPESAPPPFDPLAPEISPALVQAVLDIFDESQSQTQTISKVWGVSKSGTSPKYRAVKWKFRQILQDHNRKLPGKPWGQDADDLRTLEEIIGG